MSAKPDLDITPETRVGALLDAYPALEEELFDLSPAFKKLKNPVLRKTVAKVTTLSQAARVGNVSIGIIINRLRAAAGQTELVVEEGTGSSPESAPGWFSEQAIKRRLDARPLIEAGEKPMGKVMTALEQLEPGEVLELTTPFVPAPLIDLGKQKGFEVWHQQENAELVKTYYGKHPAKGFEV